MQRSSGVTPRFSNSSPFSMITRATAISVPNATRSYAPTFSQKTRALFTWPLVLSPITVALLCSCRLLASISDPLAEALSIRTKSGQPIEGETGFIRIGSDFSLETDFAISKGSPANLPSKSVIASTVPPPFPRKSRTTALAFLALLATAPISAAGTRKDCNLRYTMPPS